MKLGNTCYIMHIIGRNIMHIIELLLITLFTNAKVERLFSRIRRVKTILRNRLGSQWLDTQLRIGEEGCPIADFKAEDALDYWFNQKARRMNSAKSRNYPSKRASAATSSVQVSDIAAATLSDLEEEEEKYQGHDQLWWAILDLLEIV